MQWLYILYTQVYVCCCFRTECVEPTKTRLQVLLTMSKFHLEPNVPWKFYHSPWKAKHLTCWLMIFWDPHFFDVAILKKTHSNCKQKASKQSHSHTFFFLATFFESKSAATCWKKHQVGRSCPTIRPWGPQPRPMRGRWPWSCFNMMEPREIRLATVQPWHAVDFDGEESKLEGFVGKQL